MRNKTITLLALTICSAAFGQSTIRSMNQDSSSLVPNGFMGAIQNHQNVTTTSYMQSPSVPGTCGASSGTTVTNASQLTNFCSSGTASQLLTNGSSFAWSCIGNYGSSASCSANLQTQVNGVCGLDNGLFRYNFYGPPTRLCQSGTAAKLETINTNICATLGNGKQQCNIDYKWSCDGTNGGVKASCAATSEPFVWHYNG